MQKQIHFNPETGETGICSAQIACPFGGEHYDTVQEAREAYEATRASEVFKTLKSSPNPASQLIQSLESYVYLEKSKEEFLATAIERAAIAKEYFANTPKAAPTVAIPESETVAANASQTSDFHTVIQARKFHSTKRGTQFDRSLVGRATPAVEANARQVLGARKQPATIFGNKISAARELLDF